MAAAFGQKRPEPAPARARLGEIGGRAHELRALALELGERELRSYEPVLTALRLPEDDPERADRLNAALSDAANAPLAVARAAAEVAALAQEAATLGSSHLLGDAHAGLLFAEAACQAAAGLVVINLQPHPDDGRRAEALELALRAAGVRAELRNTGQ
jgi:formiminotetrahydrofolate cyclodeaminase